MAAEQKRPPLSDRNVELLLARGHVLDRRRERVVANVLRTIAHTERPRPRPWWKFSALAVATTGAVVALVLAFGPGGPGDGGWRARAIGRASDFADIGCSRGALSGCPAGSTLVWRTQLTGEGGFLSAYADPVAGGGGRIWYFAGVDSPEVPASDRPLVLSRGTRLGPEHAPGAYDIHVLATRARHSGAEIAAGPADVIAAQTTRLVVAP